MRIYGLPPLKLFMTRKCPLNTLKPFVLPFNPKLGAVNYYAKLKALVMQLRYQYLKRCKYICAQIWFYAVLLNEQFLLQPATKQPFDTHHLSKAAFTEIIPRIRRRLLHSFHLPKKSRISRFRHHQHPRNEHRRRRRLLNNAARKINYRCIGPMFGILQPVSFGAAAVDSSAAEYRSSVTQAFSTPQVYKPINDEKCAIASPIRASADRMFRPGSR